MLLEDLELKYSTINKAILTHPFIRGISNGDLAEEKFIFYLKQDYLFLIEYSRLLGLMVAKASFSINSLLISDTSSISAPTNCDEDGIISK